MRMHLPVALRAASNGCKQRAKAGAFALACARR
jgi:hypothetical protein